MTTFKLREVPEFVNRLQIMSYFYVYNSVQYVSYHKANIFNVQIYIICNI